MPIRGAQAALFGLVLICFLLPFATASCGEAPDAPSPAATSVEPEEFELKGYELVLGKEVPTDITSGLGLEDEVPYRFPSEPFAVLMGLAALVGIGVALFGRSIAAIGVAIASFIGLAAAILLGTAPVLRAVVFVNVSWEIGYWLSLFLFLAASAVGVISLRLERGRPPPDRSAPGPASGVRSTTLPP